MKESEVDMIAFFGRDIGVADKRCWLVDYGYARLEQDQVSLLRYCGEYGRRVMEVKWTGKGTDRYGERRQLE